MDENKYDYNRESGDKEEFDDDNNDNLYGN